MQDTTVLHEWLLHADERVLANAECVNNERNWQMLGDESLGTTSTLLRAGAKAEERTTAQMPTNGWSSRVNGTLASLTSSRRVVSGATRS